MIASAVIPLSSLEHLGLKNKVSFFLVENLLNIVDTKRWLNNVIVKATGLAQHKNGQRSKTDQLEPEIASGETL